MADSLTISTAQPKPSPTKASTGQAVANNSANPQANQLASSTPPINSQINSSNSSPSTNATNATSPSSVNNQTASSSTENTNNLVSRKALESASAHEKISLFINAAKSGQLSFDPLEVLTKEEKKDKDGKITSTLYKYSFRFRDELGNVSSQNLEIKDPDVATSFNSAINSATGKFIEAHVPRHNAIIDALLFIPKLVFDVVTFIPRMFMNLFGKDMETAIRNDLGHAAMDFLGKATLFAIGAALTIFAVTKGIIPAMKNFSSWRKGEWAPKLEDAEREERIQKLQLKLKDKTATKDEEKEHMQLVGDKWGLFVRGITDIVVGGPFNWCKNFFDWVSPAVSAGTSAFLGGKQNKEKLN